MKKESIEKIQAAILVISSDKDLKSDISLFLKSYVQQIKYVSQAALAFEKIDKEKPNLILLDAQWSIDTSCGLCQKLRTHASTRAIPIILMGDSNDEKKLSSFFEAGVNEFISTPFKRLELVMRVKTQLALYFANRRNQELVFTEAYHMSAIKVIKEGFVVHDKNDKIISANESAADILGLTYNQLVGKDSFDPRWKALHEDGSPFAPEDHPSMISLKKCVSVNDVIMNVHSGENNRKWISINARPIFDEEGNQSGAVATFLDITERKEASKKLKETLQQLNLTIDSAKLGVWVLNIDNDELQWNDKLLEIYGISREEFNENLSGWQEQVHPEDAEYINTRFKEVYKNKSFYDLRFRIYRPDGELRYIDGSASPVFVNNTLKKIIGVNRDITDEKRAEKQLKESEEKFSNAFNGSPIAQSILNLRTGHRLNVNQQFCKLFGYTKEEALKISLIKSPLSVDQTILTEAIKIARKNGELVGFPFDMYGANSEIRNMIIDGTNTFLNDENIFLISYSDSTNAVKQELALKESERKFSNAFNNSPVAQSILNLRTGHRLNINEACAKMFGYTREEILKTDFKKKNFAVDQGVVAEAIKLALKNGRLDDFAMDFYYADGSKKNGLINATNTFIKDEDIFIITYSDVTNTLEAERKIKESEKDVFNAIISSEEKERARYAKELHDGLGPILSTSMIYLHTLLHEKDKDKQTEYINRTYALLEDATRSIREISSNLSPDILKKYGLVQAVRSFIEKLQEVSRVKFKINSNLTNEFNEVKAFTLYRTLTELINNSIKHADANKIEISFNQSSAGIQISYADDGSGFDYEKAKKESKGFGLMNLEGRIKKIDGHYEFISAKGKGTQVEIKLQTI